VQMLMTMIVAWLSANFALPAEYDHPQVVFVAAEAMHEVRFQATGSASLGQHSGPAAPGATSEVEAFYDDATKTIHLSRDWSEDSPADLSVLVHEMVHHLQTEAELAYPCPEVREKLAYKAQDWWLKQFGRNLIDEFELDPMTLLVRTSCF